MTDDAFHMPDVHVQQHPEFTAISIDASVKIVQSNNSGTAHLAVVRQRITAIKRYEWLHMLLNMLIGYGLLHLAFRSLPIQLTVSAFCIVGAICVVSFVAARIAALAVGEILYLLAISRLFAGLIPAAGMLCLGYLGDNTMHRAIMLACVAVVLCIRGHIGRA